METDTVKNYKSLILLGLLIFFSTAAFAQNEICNDGKDNNGDGKIDCNDSFCNYAAQPTVEKGCNCFDGKDNDGDGKIDAADSDCATYYGLTFTGTGSTCSITPPNAGNPFVGIAPPQQSNQNTADTPSKISVGDMNGDGVPDAVVTSKWNSTIQVVATATASGFSPGDIMSDYRTPGKNIFPTKGADWVFEHETAIADINGDKKGEMYAIASRRPGGPNNPPVQYALCGFTYATNTLVPLFDAVDLGTVRPGSIGIADFDGDGKGEIYLRNQIYAAESGVKLADGGGNWLTTINSGPVAVNMFGDNKLELVCGPLIYSVPSLSSRTLQTLTLSKDLNALGLGPTVYPKGFNDVNQYGVNHVSTTSTADVDGDGFMDVVITGAINCSGNEAVPCANNVTTIFYWNVQKNTLSTYAPADPVYPANGWIWGTGRVNLDDANGDGKLDLVFVAGAQIFCLGVDASGNLFKQWVRAINDNPGVLSLTIYDFNNDGNPEVVYRDAQQLAVADGKTGQTTLWSSTCQAYTFTEGPIVADVNGDGGTDICITCYTSNAFNLAHDTPQQESLGQTRLYYSSTNSWLPTRRVWNEHPYYVTNINDNLTLPFPQLDPSLNFGNAPCPNGIPGPHRPFNVFMDQVPTLSADGCPIYPAPDLTFFGDDPAQPGVDTNGDGKYSPTVVIVPPICGNTNITGQFNIINNGSLPISDNVPFAFFDGDPTANPTTATRLYTNSFTITNLQVGQTYTSPVYSFNGTGKAFTLYIVIYNNGATLPIVLTGQSNKECSISNNLYSVAITPTPFSVTVEKLSDNNNCPPYNPPNTGQLRTHIFVGGVEVVDYSPYAFQWYSGSGTTTPIAGATAYNLSNLDAGTYSVVVTNTQKGCSNPFVTGTIARVNGGFPNFTITKISDQTICTPPNGEVVVAPDDGSTGYAYSWLDTNLNPIGVTSADAKNLVTGNYIVNISRGTCNYPGTRPQIFVPGPQVADAQAKTLQNVVDCSNPNTGSIQADAYIGVTVQNPANYTFDWYFYNNATSTRGSLLPGTYGTGQIRTGLPVGYYQAVVTDNTTKCVSSQSPIAQVQSQTVIPDPPVIRQLAAQTSCDPTKPNGSMIADVYVGGVLQNPSGFTFQWFKGQNTLPANLVATVSGINGQEVDKVAGGGIPYTVKVTTPFNCTSTFDAPVIENINQPVLTLTQLTPNTVCDAAKATTPYNGSIQATVTFAGNPVTLPDPNYTFSWYDGTTTTTPHNPATSQSNVLTGLKDADYAATVNRTDLSCLSVPETVPVTKATVNPILSPTSTGSNNCDPALTPDGTVTVAVTNVVAGDVFSYQWYSGNSIVPANALGAANNGTSATAIKVGGPVGAPNPYTVYVLNKTTGCDNNTTQFVADNSVVPVLSTSVTGNGVCDPALGFQGTMTVSVTNIPALYTIADYSFTWYDGATTATAHVPQPSPASTTTLGTLDSKTFSVIGTNTKTGCVSAIATNNIPNAKVFPTLAPSSTGSNNCVVGGGINNDGTASVVASGTPGPYTYQWHTGNIDPNTAPAPIAGATSSTLSGVGGPVAAPHSYTVLVKDAGTGCTAFTPSVVQDNSVTPILSTTPAPNDICDPAKGFAGSITVGVTNIPPAYTIGDYNFTWKDSGGTTLQGPSSAILLSQLDVGTYSVSGINTKTGCQSLVATDQVADTKSYPVIQIATTGSHNCSNLIVPDGTAAATVTAIGADTFTYAWTAVAPAAALTAANNPSSATAIKLGGPTNAPNSYKVVVTDTRTGCANNNTGQVADLSSKPTLTLQAFDNHVCDKTLATSGQFDGHVDETSVTSNIAPGYAGSTTYTYTWMDVTNSTTLLTNSPATTITQLNSGDYSATVTITELGCTSDPVPAQVLPSITLPLPVASTTPNTNCPPTKAANGVASITTVDGNPAPGNYTYQWYDGGVIDPLKIRAGETSPALANGATFQGTQSFIALVTNKTTGCQGNAPVTIVDAKVTPTIAVTLVQNNDICDLATLDPDGELLATPSNAGATFTITWSGGVAPAVPAGATNDHYTKLKAGGPYSAIVTDNTTGCSSLSDSQNIIDQLVYPVIAVTETDQTSCDVNNPNGKLDASATTPAGVTFTWYNGVGTAGGVHAQTAANSGIIDKLKATSVSNLSYTVQALIASTGCASTQTNDVVSSVAHPVVALNNSQQVTTCGVSPNGEATTTITGLVGGPAFPTIKYDLFYVYTKSGGTFPSDSLTLVSSGDANNKSNATALPAAPSYTGMAPGYLTAYVVDKNTLCTSSINTVQIIDATKSYSFIINATQQAGLCGGGGGGIDVTVERSDNPGVNCATCTFSWYKSTPTNTNINFFNNPPVMPTAVLVAPDVVNEDLGDTPSDPNPPGVGTGSYTLVVLDTDPTHKDCGNYFTDFVPPSSLPTALKTLTHITDCVTPNGNINVTSVAGASGVGYTIKIFQGTDNTGTLVAQAAVPANPASLTTSPNLLPTTPFLAKGDYYLEYKDNDPVNINCPFGEVVTLKKLVLPPLLTPAIVGPNTSCDPNLSADGSAQITATSDASDTQAKVYQITAISPAVAGYATPNTIGTGASGQSEVIPGMRPVGYTVTVVDANSHCSANVPLTIPDVQSAPDVLSAVPTPETMCAAASNGTALASVANTLSTDLTKFDFTWAQNNDLSAPVYASAGDGLGTQGELLNQAHATAGTPGSFWPMGAAGSGSGNRTFYVQGVKNASAVTGVGCKTSIIQVVIPDQHVTPDMTLTPKFDSFCLATAVNGQIGDGTITIAADADPATPGQQNAAGGFDYSWTTPNAGLASPQLGQSNNFVIPKLGDGSYTVTATNATNKCVVSNAVAINPAPYVITVDLTDPVIDQRICGNDGLVRIKQITLKDNSAGSPNSSTDANAAIDPLYSFQWYNNGALTAGTELRENGGVTPLIITRTLSNDDNQDQLVNQAGDYQAMTAGTYYVIATRSDATKIGFGCPSLPFQVTVNDVHKNPVPTLAVLSNTSCLPAGPGEGEISITVADATAAPFNGGTYTYTWIAPGPIPANPPATNLNPGAGNGNGSSGDGDNDQYTQLIDNATLGNANPYTVSIKNIKTGCTVSGSATILKNALPVFVQTVTAADQILCGPDGSLTVAKVSLNDRTGASEDFVTAPGAGQGSIFDFDFKWTRSSSVFTQTTTGAGDNVLNLGTYNAGGFGIPIGADAYTVTAVRKTGTPGAGCSSSPFPVAIQNKQINPVVTLTPFSNTSCDPAFFEGEIKVKVSDATTETAPPGGFTFNYDWTGSPHPVSALTSTGNNGNEVNDGAGPDHDYETGLQDDASPYTVKVVNATTLCSTTATATIIKNATPVFIQNVVVVDQILCSPDGSLTVSKVTLNDRTGLSQAFDNSTVPAMLTDFQFEWTRVGDANNYVGVMNGAAAPLGATLNAGNYSAFPTPPGFAPPFGAGTYTVVARRKAGSPGTNCASAPYSVVLQDKSIKPIVTLTPLANTSCDPAFFEGEITVTVTDASPAGVTNFTYAWDNVNDPTSIITANPGANNGNGSGADGDEDNPKNLKEGTYNITVTSNLTTCTSTASTTIFKNGTPVFTQLVISTPQVLCNPDGSLVVKEVKIIDRNGVVQSNLNAPPDFALSDFEFTYDRVIGGVTTNVLTKSPDAFLDKTNYNVPAIPPGVGFGTYYVTTTRKNGFPGKDCSSAPYKVDIDDQRLLPRIAFTSIANSSCNVAKPNGSITAAASEQNGTNSDPYTFAWTLNGQPIGAVLPTPPTQTDASPNSVITNALDGAYIATVTNTNTGCPFDASFNLQLDQTRSTPNIIDVATVDPLDCNPSASATVTKITLGSTFNSTTQPPNIPPNNAITGPALAGFTYIWAAGTPANVIAGQTAPMITGLEPGAYFVSVVDPNTDCQSGPKETDISNLKIIYPTVSIAQTAKQISCLAATGTAALAATAVEQDGTIGTYNFTWYPSLDTTGVAFTAPQAPSTTNNPNTLGSLFVGNYSVKVQNPVTSCKAMALFIVPDDAPTFTPVISGTSDPLTLCVGVDGDAQVRVIPDPNYPNPPSYNYKADLYVGASPNLGNPPDFANLPSLPGPIPGVALVFEETGLNLGFYTFLVTDNNTGCTTKATVEVKDGRAKPVITIVQDNPLTNCDPAIANGQLSATADNGKTQGYLFEWYSGASVTNPGSPLQTDDKLIGEGAGTYTVRVTSNLTHCFDDKTGSITDSTFLPPIPTAIVVADRTSCISPNGDVSATVGGVILNYLFSWYDGSATKPAPDYQSPDYPSRDIGPYTVTAKDLITGCISPPATVTVQDKRVNPDFDLSSTASYCVDTGRPKGTGSVTLTLNSQGMVLSDIQWTDHNTNAPVGIGPQVFELFPGVYDVKAVSTDGCETDGSVEIGTEISPYNGVSSNNDGQNDSFIIDCITNFPNNNVKIFNRNGIKVFEVNGYDNGLISFKGIGEEGLYLANRELPVGTYFYIVDKRDGSKPKTGFLELTR